MKKGLALTLTVAFLLSLLCACSTGEPAVMNVGETKISALEYNYTYYSQVYEFYNGYSSYLSYFGLDQETPLKEQSCSLLEDGGTWADFFMEQTEDLLQQIYCLYNEAVANGVTLNEEFCLQLDSYLLAATEAAEEKNQTLDEYLSENYGEGLTESHYRTFLSHRLLATQYCDEVLGAVIYSDEEYEAYYLKNRESLDRITFRIFTVTEQHLPADTQAEDEDAVALAVKDYAELFAKDLTSEEAFCQRALAYALEEEKEIYGSASATLATNVSADDLAESDMKTWLFDESRCLGDVAVHKTSTAAYTICYFISRGRDESNLASMRHILLTVDETAEKKSESEVSDAIHALYDRWQAQGLTEEAFIALASEYTEDPGSKNNGGLYEAFARGTMTSEIDDWLYSEGRKKGDSAIIKTVHGYHIVLFLGYGEVGWKSECYPALQDEDYFELLSDLSERYPVSFTENHREDLGNAM